MTTPTWLIRETSFDPAKLRPQESVFTIGNGVLSTRGAFEEGYPGEWATTMIHGVFDHVPIVMTELANAPNWLPLAVTVGGERVRLDQGELLSYERILDLSMGVLRRAFRWRSPQGRTVDVRYERFTSLADTAVLAQRVEVTLVDGAGEVVIEGGFDGHVTNLGFVHWNKVAQGQTDNQTVYLVSRTRQTGILLGQAARLAIVDCPDAAYAVHHAENRPVVVARVQAQPGQTVTAEKIVTLFSALDAGRAVREAALDTLNNVAASAGVYDRLKAANAEAWAKLWDTTDIIIEGDDEAQVATRYSLFQLLIAAPRHDEYVSIAAKTMSGFGYRGHVFWDTEIFILPMFTFTQPALARNLLLYRYHTLGGARTKARENGFQGAQYPWESAMIGDEVTPKTVPGPDGKDVRIWTGDIEIHISSDIAFAVWQYWQVTGDDAFMRDYGAEMILDTAQFWGSRAEWVAEKERYEVNDVIGPDEYHEHVDNNFYTNYLLRWHLRLALSLLDWLAATASDKRNDLVTRLGLTEDQLDHWRDIIARITILQAPETGLFEQFEGYFERRDVDLAALEPRHKSVQALFGIEETNHTQVLKQPDVLMLFYMLPNEFDARTVQANWDYYTPRTDLTHGSSLAPGIQAILACRMGDAEAAYPFFRQAALVDLKDLRLNAEHGIHGAAAGSVWQAAVFGFGGIRVTEHGLVSQPHLPSHWRRLKFKIVYKGEVKEFDFH
ncbi:MAG: glycoside hydrolase family 65 protein [Anaerolineae bacterium]|nr:glycoside hydrolase family 65 protein [Anaerolineae bacterium]